MTIKRAPEALRRGHVFVVIAALLIAVIAVIYTPGASGGFIFDDRAAIVENRRVHIHDLTRDSLARAARSFEPGNGLQARPLSMASFGVNHALHELRPFGYKTTGIAIHALNAVLILMLAHGLIGAAWRERDPRWAAAAVAIAWALHPLQVSTVLYVVQRMESLSLLFVLTVVTVLALPINILAGLFGMNVGGIPLAEHKHGFWLVVAIVVTFTAIAAWLAFRKKR